MPTGIYNHIGNRRGVKLSLETKRKMSETAKRIGTGKWMRGWKPTEETRKKMSESHKGLNTWMKGRKLSKETRQKMSNALMGRILSKEHKRKLSGENNHNWKGGVNSVIARRAKLKNAIGSHVIGEWQLLKKQYGYTCPACKKQEPEIKLTEDHIIPLSKGGSNYIENIQPLCKVCNSKKYTNVIKYKI